MLLQISPQISKDSSLVAKGLYGTKSRCGIAHANIYHKQLGSGLGPFHMTISFVSLPPTAVMVSSGQFDFLIDAIVFCSSCEKRYRLAIAPQDGSLWSL